MASDANIRIKSPDYASVSLFTRILKHSIKMKAVFLVLLIATAILAATNAASVSSMNCGPNSEYSDCMTACEPKCNEQEPQICTDQCIRGCRCLDGFLLNNNNECVQSLNC